MSGFIKRHIRNNFVSVFIALPNLAITSSTIFVLTVIFHWSGFYALMAYFVGQVFSVQYSALFGQVFSMEFTVAGRTYHYGRVKK